MSNDTQKIHGLPSFGVIAKQGTEGSKGRGVYFGYLNDFFIIQKINDGDSLYVVSKKDSSNGYFDANYNDAIADPQDVINVVDITDPSSKNVLYDITLDDNTNSYINKDANQLIIDMAYLPDEDNEEPVDIFNPSGCVFYDNYVWRYDPSKGIEVGYLQKSIEPSNNTIHNTSAYYLKKTDINNDIVINVKDGSNFKDSKWIKTGYFRLCNDNEIISGIGYVTDDDNNTIEFDLSCSKEEQIDNYAAIQAGLKKDNNVSSYCNFTNLDAYFNLPNTSDYNTGIWDVADDAMLQYPQTLKDEYKTGDVIIYYDDKDVFKYNRTYTGIFTVSNDTEGADYTVIKGDTTKNNNFQYENFSDVGVSLLLRNLLGISNYNKDKNLNVDNSLLQKFHQNFIKKCSLENDTMLMLSKFDISTSCLFACSNASVVDETPTIDTNIFTVNISNNNAFVINCVNNLKFPKLYINKNTSTNAVLDDFYDSYNLKLYDNYLYTFKEDDFNPQLKGFILKDSNLYEFNAASKDYNFGAIITNLDTTNVTVVYAENNIIVLPIQNDGPYNYTIMLFVELSNNIKLFGKTTSISFNVNKGNINQYTVSSADLNYIDTLPSNDDILIDIMNISPEESDKVTVEIYANPDVSNIEITDYKFKGISFEDVNDISNNIWLKCSVNYPNECTNTSCILHCSVSDNLPPVLEQSQTHFNTINGIMSAYSDHINNEGAPSSSLFYYLQKEQLINTGTRKDYIVVDYTKNNVSLTAYLPIEQPGFVDPRVMPTITFNSHNAFDEIEKLNRDELGILCNQFQYFVDINIDGFSKETWGKFGKNYTMNLTIKNNQEDFNVYTTNKHAVPIDNPTITLIDPNLERLKPTNNWFNISVGIYNEDLDIFNTPVSEYKNYENTSTCITTDYQYFDSSTHDWTKLKDYESTDCSGFFVDNINDISTNFFEEYDASGKQIYKRSRGIIKNHTIEIKNIQLDQTNFKLRVFVELAEPVPALFNFKWYVDKIEIIPEGATDSSSNWFVAHDSSTGTYNILHTTKQIYTDKVQRIPTFMTDEYQFFINPLSVIVAPDVAYDNLVLNEHSIKMTGSDDLLKVGIGNYGWDITEWYMAINDPIINQIDWNDWVLYKRFMQDNISDIKFINKNPFTDVFAVDPFVKLNEILKDTDYQFTSDEDDIFEENSFVNVEYDSAKMYAKQRDDIYTFYYNGEEIKADRYSQTNGKPIYAKLKASAKLRDDMLLKSMEVWNFEWENVNYFKESESVPGAISRYSNGYNLLKDEADYNQYDEEEALSLKTTQDLNDVIALNKMEISDLTDFNNCTYAPDADKVYRTLIWNINYEVPLFGNEKLSKYNIVGINDALQTYVDLMNSTPEDETITKNIIPYNHCFNIYPRVAYDDKKKFTHVLMLRRPGIGKDDNYTFDNIRMWSK